MHINNYVLYVPPNINKTGYTNRTCPQVGIFTISGFFPNQEHLKPHPIILDGIMLDGHALRVNIGYGTTGRLTIENISEPASNASFNYKHSGQTKKKFNPGEIISPPEVHNLLWDATDLQGNLVTVTLALIPLQAQSALRVFYTLSPKK